MSLFSRFFKAKVKESPVKNYSNCDLLCATLFNIVSDLESPTNIKSSAFNDLTIFAALAFLIDPILERNNMRDRFNDSFRLYTKIYSGDDPRSIALVFKIVEDQICELKQVCDLKSADDIEFVMFDVYMTVTESEEFVDLWFEHCDKKFKAAAAEAIKWAFYYSK